MELDVRRTFIDLEHDSTIAWDRLTDFQYVSKGGFALVFMANLRRSDGVVQPVAVKVLKPENHFRPAIYSKFLQEVAFQTALTHSVIVRALGFCSVPVGPLIAAAPPGILTPDSGGGGGGGGGRNINIKKAALLAQEWFAKRRLMKCWALVMELMSDGNMFDQVLAAARGGTATATATAGRQTGTVMGVTAAAAAAGGGGGSAATGMKLAASGPGSYGDVQGLLWLTDVADAMTFLHSQQPLLIHRDLKLENILLQREPDGRVRAKLSDFGLTVGVDVAGRKVPPPQVLCAPGQTVEEVRAAVPGGGAAAQTALPERPCSSSAHATAAVAFAAAAVAVNAAPKPPGGTPSRSAPASSWQLNVGHPSPSPLRNPKGLGDPEQQQQYKQQQYQQYEQKKKKQQLMTGRKVMSSLQVLVQATAARGLGHAQAQAQAQTQAQAQGTPTAAPMKVAAAAGPRQGGAAAVGPNPGLESLGVGKLGGGRTTTAAAAAAPRRPWSAAQAQLQPPPHLPLPMQSSHEATAVGAAELGNTEQEESSRKPPRPSSSSSPPPAPSAQGEEGSGSVYRNPAVADAAPALLRPQRSSVSWSGSQRHIGDDALGYEHQVPSCVACADPSSLGLPRPGLGADGLRPAEAPQQQQGRVRPQAPGAPPQPINMRASASRLSETGHMQVKMEQLNGLLRMGMGHKDYLPDMYQMTFKLTCQCGSVCYMAPEVARQLPYNQKADVYSFGCLVYEVMTRQLLSDSIPEGDMDAAMEYLGRVAWCGWRPDLPTWLPKDLRLLISLCWHREPRLRPSFPTISARLRAMLLATAMGPLQAKASLGAPQPPLPLLAPQLSQQQLLEIQMQAQHQKSKEQQQQQQQQWVMLQQQQKQQQLLLLQQQISQYLPDQLNNQQSTKPARMLGSSVSTGNMLNAFQHTTMSGGGTTATASAASGAAPTTAQQIQMQAHRQQLQLQMQQLNACTRAAGGTSTFTNIGLLRVPYSVNSVSASRRPLHVESTGTIMTSTTTSTATTGCRMSSPVLGAAPGGRGGGPGTLEPAVVHPAGRATTSALTMMTATGPQNNESSYYSALPSPVSPSSSRAGNRRSSGCPALGPGPTGAGGPVGHDRASGQVGPGHDRASRGQVSRSEGSAGAVSGASSFRTPRGQQHQHQQLQQQMEQQQQPGRKDSCMSLCLVM